MKKPSVKKMIALMLSVLMLGSLLAVTAFADTYGAFGYTLVEPEGDQDFESYIQIYSYKRDDTSDEVVANIPEAIEKVSPKMITAGAFKNNNTAENVIIPNTVELIENAAFYGCQKLKFIIIPDSVTLIGDSAFQNCPELEYVIIGNGCAKIGDIAFKGCSKLKAVQFGSGLKEIGDGAFYGCDSLESVYIPSNVEAIGSFAFGFKDGEETATNPAQIQNFQFFADNAQSKCVSEYLGKRIMVDSMVDGKVQSKVAEFQPVKAYEKCDGEHDAELELGRVANISYSGMDIGLCKKCGSIVIKENNDIPETKLNIAGLIFGVVIVAICVAFVVLTLIYNKKVKIRRDKAIEEWAKDHPEDIDKQYYNRIARKKADKKKRKEEKKQAKSK